MDGHGVAMSKVGDVELVAGEALQPPIVHGGGQLPALDVDGEHGAALRGHDLPTGARGQGHDAVPGPVAGGSDDKLLARQPAEALPCDTAPLVQLGHVGPPPGVHGRGHALGHVGGPAGDHGVERRVPVRRHGDATGAGVPGHGLVDLARAQLGQRRPLAGVDLAHVLGEYMVTAVA